MPHSVSAMKRVRQNAKARFRNQSEKAKIATIRRKLFAAFTAKDAESARKLYPEYCSVLDKAAKRGIIAKNTAVRRKRRSAHWLMQIAPKA